MMTKTIVAIYDDIAVARQVVEDLVNADFARSTISLITNDAQNLYSHYLDKNYAPREDAVTTTAGAGFGAVVGTLTGILVSLVGWAIPGIGLEFVPGPIAAGLIGVLIGAVIGGIVGTFVKSGVPKDVAPYYAEGIRRGGTVISIDTSDILRASDIMNRYGSINIHERSTLWRQAGWKGFDAASVDEKDSTNSPEMVTAITSDTTTTRVTHMSHNDSSTTVPPVERVVETEPQIDSDAADSVPVTTAPASEIEPPVTRVADVTGAEPIPPIVDEEPDIADGMAQSIQDIEL